MFRIAIALLAVSILAVAAASLATEDESAAVRGVLDKYLESATFPGKPEFDPEIFPGDKYSHHNHFTM